MIRVNKNKILIWSVIPVIFIIVFIYLKPERLMRSIYTGNRNRPVKIGFSMDSLVVERWESDRDLFLAKAKQLGADVIVENANNNSEEQVKQIKYLINQNIDVLVVIPHDSDYVSSAVIAAKKKGIKVIAYDRLVKKAGVDLYISFDNSKVGELMAKALYDKAPKGNYLIINGGKEDYNTHFVNDGFKKALEPYTSRGDINIINEVWAASWKEDEAYKCVEDAINKGQKIDGIMAGNDRLAEAAIQALSEWRLAGKTYVVGQDAALSGCQKVVEGTQLMTVYKPVKLLAEKSAEYAVKLGRGEKIKANSKLYDGKQNVPFQVEDPVAIYKSNMTDVIKDNFHSIEDIYRNVPKSDWPQVK